MKWPITMALVSSVTLVTACGGDGAGDVFNNSGENTAGPNLVEQFVGVWQLTSGWSTTEPDTALLVFRTPNDSGESAVVVYDFTDETDVQSQCYREPFGNGEAFSSLTDEVFINFSSFTNGVVTSVSENAITITFDDTDDINGNRDTAERLTTALSRVGLVESEISPICNG
jgi:hypothetical protein